MSASLYKLRSDVRFRLVGGEAVILRQDDGEVLVLNEVGSRVVQLIESQQPVERILEAIDNEYEVERQTLIVDIESFLADLENAGVIEGVAEVC